MTTFEIQTEAHIFGDDPELDGTRIPHQERWKELSRPEYRLPVRPEEHMGAGSSAVYFALSF